MGKTENKTKKITFVSYPKENGIINSWDGTINALRCEMDEIVTSQMGLLHTRLFEMGYCIFISERVGDEYEIRLGERNERTNREIKMGHNLFKMWMSGEFSVNTIGMPHV